MGRLCRLNLRTGKLTVLLDDPEGSVRDPQVHYDGRKILFSYRPGGSDYFHLYEINVDGSGLRQLTDGPLRRHRADLPARRPDHVLLQPLQALGELLVHAGGRALRLRRRRQEHPPALRQHRARQHALAAARRARDLHALGIRRSQPGLVPPSLDDQSRRHRPDGLLRQPAPGHRDDRRQADPRHATRSWPSSRPATASGSTPARSPSSPPRPGPTITARRGTISQGDDYRDPYPLSADCFLVAQGPRLLRDGRRRARPRSSTGCRRTWPRPGSSATSRGRCAPGRASRSSRRACRRSRRPAGWS